MTAHPSTSQLEQFCVSALADDEAATVAVHLADCPACDERFVEELRRQVGSGPFTFTLEPQFWFQHDHLDLDLLAALADGKIDPCTREILDLHLSTCESCHEDVRSFLAYREAKNEESCIEAE